MRSDIKTFGANRLFAALFFILSGALAASIFVPGVTEYVANGNFVGRIRIFNSLEPEHRLVLAYVFAGLMALTAVTFLRLLIDNTMVVLDREGIEVRHPFRVHRALWRDYDTITATRFLAAKTIYIRFHPGWDERGRKLLSKVRLPGSMLGIDNKAVVIEALARAIVTEAKATRPTGPQAPAVAGTARPAFGRRQ